MSDLLNVKKQIELEVLTPLHIGAGSEKDWMKGADYISDNNKVYILNHKKVSKSLKGGVDELANYLLKKDDTGLKTRITGDLESVSDIVFNSPTGSENDIKTFIKNGLTNKPIVPGSSLKGAIRSILLSYFIDSKNQIDRRNKRFEEEIFGSANKGDEFMRFIKIADAQFEKTELINTKIFNLFGTAPNLNGGWKHKGGKFGETNNKFRPNGFNTIYEIIAPNKTGELSIALANRAFDSFISNNSSVDNKIKINKENTKKNILNNNNIRIELFAIINAHTKKYIDKQIAFFEKYSNNETPQIIESLEAIKTQIPNDNSACVLQMSAGSGFHSITGDWQFDDFSIDGVKSGRGPSRGQLHKTDSAKSRKIATDGKKFDLMGFVKLSILTEELMAKREAEKQAKLEKERIVEEERLAKEKAEKDRIETEKQAKIEAERKAEADRLAKERAEQEEKERIRKEANDKLLKAQAVNKDKRAKESEENVAKGLSDLDGLNEFNKGKTIIKKYFKANNEVIADNQITLLKNFVTACIKKKNKRWKKEAKQDWVLVVKWVGKPIAKNWYNELIEN